jgi:aminoglycoside/choline kinase family phosphotransferase
VNSLMAIEPREVDQVPMVPVQAIELAARHLGTAPPNLALTRLAGDASSRVYFRARPSDGPTNKGSSIIIALYPAPFDINESAAARLAKSELSDSAVRLTFANDPCAHLEVTLLFLEAGLPVPKIIGVAGSDGVMLIEELGDCRLQDWLGASNRRERVRAYRHAIELIIRIQEMTQLALNSESICSRLAFDEAKLKWELDFFFKNYFERHLALNLDPESAGSIDAEFTELCRELSTLPRVLVHRDYHARNLMMQGSKMFIIDHQDARMGPESYDLVSLIADPYAAIDADFAGELVEYFIGLKSKSGLPLSGVDQFQLGRELVTVQRTLKAAGTYSFQAAVKNNPAYLPYINPAIESALGAMRRLGRFQRLRGLLEGTLDSA